MNNFSGAFFLRTQKWLSMATTSTSNWIPTLPIHPPPHSVMQSGTSKKQSDLTRVLHWDASRFQFVFARRAIDFPERMLPACVQQSACFRGLREKPRPFVTPQPLQDVNTATHLSYVWINLSKKRFLKPKNKKILFCNKLKYF